MRQVNVHIYHKRSGHEYALTMKIGYAGDSLSLLQEAIQRAFEKKCGADYILMYWYLL